MILLDTSFLIDYFRGSEETKKLIENDVAITTITYHEIMTGVKWKKAKNEERFFRRFFSSVRILEYDIRAAEESSTVASRLSAIGKEVNALDLLITGIAVANGIDHIATRDKDFSEIAKVTALTVLTY